MHCALMAWKWWKEQSTIATGEPTDVLQLYLYFRVLSSRSAIDFDAVSFAPIRHEKFTKL